MFKRLTAAAALLSILLMLVCPAMALDSGKAETTADWLNFRAAPDMSGRVLDLIPFGTEVEILEDLGSWCKIKWDGVIGYVYTQYLHQELPAAPQQTSAPEGDGSAVPEGVVFGFVLGDEVRFRKAPALTGNILGYFYHGILVEVLEEGTQWTTVEYAGTVGYVSTQYLRIGTPTAEELAAAENAYYLAVYQPDAAPVTVQPEKQPAAQPEKTPTAAPADQSERTAAVVSASQSADQANAPVQQDGVDADDIITTAKSCLGVPYVYGGTSMKGFDCSGFTSYVFAQNGITLSRTATAQYKQGTAIKKSELQPGDLVFFSNESSHGAIGHVGIYIGDGKIVHASSGAYKKIVIADLYSSWFVTYYYGACRIL